MSKYISITLGPISRAIDLAESTKELWAASYFFAYLAKKIIEPFRNRTFLLPMVSDKRIWVPQSGAGLFPDRYIFEAEENDFTDLTTNVDDVLKDISGEICLLLKPTQNAEDVYNYLKSYLKIYFFEKSFDENGENFDPKKIIPECERCMNLIEMQDTFPEKETENYLQMLFKNVNGAVFQNGKLQFNGSFLSKEAFGDLNGQRLFESIIEISAAEKIDKLDLNEYIELNYEIEQEKDKNNKKVLEDKQDELLRKKLSPYHKYIAIVKTDGDSIGKANDILPIEGISRLNQGLIDFNIGAVTLINQYKGKPIFLGGDDLFFLAPVFYKDKNIFDLLKELDDCFNEKIKIPLKEQFPDIPDITLSFGVSITYFKYPMFEALENCDYLLTGLAKSGEIKTKLRNLKIDEPKNGIAFAIQKHSGQVIQTVIRKQNKKSYAQLLKIISDYTKKGQLDSNRKDEDTEHKDSFLSSVMHKLNSYEPMLKFILEKDSPDSQILMKNFFDNNFNESGHDQYRGLLEQIQELLLSSYEEYRDNFENYNTKIKKSTIPDDKKDELLVCPLKETIHLTYSALRFIHFINAKNDE
jgi:CRISPR-associated protein Cmr2